MEQHNAHNREAEIIQLPLAGAPMLLKQMPLPQLAERTQQTLARKHQNRAEWVEIMLDLCRYLTEAKSRFPDTTAFGVWLRQNDLSEDRLGQNDRLAAISMGRDLEKARGVLESTCRTSLQHIYREEWRKDATHSSEGVAHRPRRYGRKSYDIEALKAVCLENPGKTNEEIGEILGAGLDSVARGRRELGLERKPGPRRPRSAPPARSKPEPAKRRHDPDILHLPEEPRIRTLTRGQVDPEFSGTPDEWVDKYGHVQTMTAEQYATMRFGETASNFKALAAYYRKLPPLARPLDLNWLRSPKDTDIARMIAALELLRPVMASGEAALARALEAKEKK